MPTAIEKIEYQKPIWQEFSWGVNGQKISGVYSELEGGSENLVRVKVAIPVPADAQNVMIDIRSRKRVERSAEGPSQRVRDVEEEFYLVSYWSPGLKIGDLISIPRELAEIREGEAEPRFIQIEQVSVYSYGVGNTPTYSNLM